MQRGNFACLQKFLMQTQTHHLSTKLAFPLVGNKMVGRGRGAALNSILPLKFIAGSPFGLQAISLTPRSRMLPPQVVATKFQSRTEDRQLELLWHAWRFYIAPPNFDDLTQFHPLVGLAQFNVSWVGLTYILIAPPKQYLTLAASNVSDK